jgi:hypothetical protein
MKKILIIFILLVTKSYAENVPCIFDNCDKKFPETFTRFHESIPKNNKPMILWLQGGSGQSLSTQPIDKLEKKYDIITFFNPYDIDKGVKDGYPPQAYKPDQADRIKSVVVYYKNKYNKNIWLGGISNGAPRIASFLGGSPENQKLISGAIFTGSHTGRTGTKIRLSKIKDLNLPIAVIHHTRDQCPDSAFKPSQTFFKLISKKNAGFSAYYALESGDLKSTTSCKPQKGKFMNHTFDKSREEIAEVISNFIDQNTK